MVDHTDLEDEVLFRRVFSFYAKREFKKWKVEREKLEILLKQATGFVQSLVGDLDILRDVVFHLRDELRYAREVKA